MIERSMFPTSARYPLSTYIVYNACRSPATVRLEVPLLPLFVSRYYLCEKHPDANIKLVGTNFLSQISRVETSDLRIY